MLRVERLVHKVALRVSEKTKKSIEQQDPIEGSVKYGPSGTLIKRLPEVPSQTGEQNASRYPHSPDDILGYSSDTQNEKDHDDRNPFPPLEAPTRENTPSISEPVQSPSHKRSVSDSGLQQSSADELWILHHSASKLPHSSSNSQSYLSENRSSEQKPSRSPSPKYLTPQYAPPPYQRQHASSFSAYSPPRSFTSVETTETRTGRPKVQTSQPLNRYRTHSAPEPTSPVTTRADTMQIVKSRRLSEHPLSLLPGPSFSAYRPLPPSELQKKVETPPAPVTAEPAQVWELSTASSNVSMETLKKSRTDGVDDVSTLTSSTRSTSTRADTQSPDIILDTPSTIIDTPLEQGLATAMTFQRNPDIEPKILLKMGKEKNASTHSNLEKHQEVGKADPVQNKNQQRQFSFEESPVWMYKSPFRFENNDRPSPENAESDTSKEQERPTSDAHGVPQQQPKVETIGEERSGRSRVSLSREVSDGARSRSMSRPRPHVYQKGSPEKEQERSRAQSMGPEDDAASKDRRRSLTYPIPLLPSTVYKDEEKTKERSGRSISNLADTTKESDRSRSASRPRSQSRPRSSKTYPYPQPLPHVDHTMAIDGERSGRPTSTSADTAKGDDRSRSASRPRSQSRPRTSMNFSRPPLPTHDNSNRMGEAERSSRSAVVSADAAKEDTRNRSASRPRNSMNYSRPPVPPAKNMDKTSDETERSGRSALMSAENTKRDDRSRSASRPGTGNAVPRRPVPPRTGTDSKADDGERSGRPASTSPNLVKGDDGSRSASKPRSQSRPRNSMGYPQLPMPLSQNKSTADDNERSGRPTSSHADRAAREDRNRSQSRPRSSSRPRYYAQLNEEKLRASEDKERADEAWKTVEEIGVAVSNSSH